MLQLFNKGLYRNYYNCIRTPIFAIIFSSYIDFGTYENEAQGNGGVILQENKFILYFYMLIGAFGIAIILLCSVMYMLKEQNSVGYIGVFSALLVIIYINFLEKRAGISTKLI